MVILPVFVLRAFIWPVLLPAGNSPSKYLSYRLMPSPLGYFKISEAKKGGFADCDLHGPHNY